MVLILVKQVIQMFLMAAVGFLLFRYKKITADGSKTVANILIYTSLPCVIVNGFLIERTPENIKGLLISAAAAAVLLLFSIIISRSVFGPDPIAHFASSFSNPGFFGIPLILASLGQGAVFFIACFIAYLNILQWTYGTAVLTAQPARRGFSLQRLLKAPFFIAFMIGLVLFFTGFRPPAIVTGPINAISGLNTPLSMFMTGIYLAQTDIRAMIKRKSLILVTLMRLIAIPLVSLLVLSLLPGTLTDMKYALLLAAACPVGANVAVYAHLYGKDYTYAVETVVVSTFFSILSIPLITAAAGLLFGL